MRGFTNADIRRRLVEFKALGSKARTLQEQSVTISRLFHRVHVDGLIAKVARARRW